MSTLQPEAPVWQLALTSFFGSRHQKLSAWMVKHGPMTGILFVQAVITLRLSNSAYRDEGLYIYEGHRQIASWLHHTPNYDSVSSYFSGAPGVYPVIAAGLDRLGGLEMVRVFSLLCMLIATASIHSATSRLFSRRAGILAALVFALAGSTAMLGNFATFDAMSLSLLALALALGVRAVQTNTLAWGLLIGPALALAVVTKYVAVIFVPSVLVIILLTPTVYRWAAPKVAVSSALVAGGIVAGLAATICRDDVAGFKHTSTNRVPIVYRTYLQIAQDTWGIAGLWLCLGALGMVYLLRHRHQMRLAVVLMGTGLLPILSQARIHEGVSLDKHIDFGLIFIVPLAGVLLGSVRKPVWVPLPITMLVVLAITGLTTSNLLFHQWSESSAMSSTMAYSFKADPYIHTLGDNFEPFRYHFEDSTQQWQWSTTDAVYYDGLAGEPAAVKGLHDHYWQYVYFIGTGTADGISGSTAIGRAMLPRMKAFGYKLTGKVRLSNLKYGEQTFYIFQNYQPRGDALKN